MTKQAGEGGVKYSEVGKEYFEKRELQRHAGVWSLWALGVGAVISGDFSGWNLGFASGGWGGMAIATILVGLMYLALVFCIAEMSPALPHTGGAYSFARTSLGPWAGFLTGLAENVEYVVTPAVIVYFVGSYLGGIFGTDTSFQPVYWVGCYIVFLALNVFGVALSFRVTVIVTFLALAILIFFYVSAWPHIDFNRWALNIAPDGSELPDGNGPYLPFGWAGVFASLPFAVWLFLAIEELPLAAEESIDPKRDMPKGIILGMLTLLATGFLILWLNPALIGVGAHKLGSSGEPILDGFRAIYGENLAKLLSLFAVTGLVASFHTILFAQGRQIYSLSRAGYFPTFLSLTHGTHKTPHIAMIVGTLVGLGLIFAVASKYGIEGGGAVVGGALLNMAVFGAMFSYIMQALSFIRLRQKLPNIERPYVSPLGIFGGIVTIVIAAITMVYQLRDPVYQNAVIGVAIWFGIGILYFALVGRHHLVLSPEETFATKHRSDN